MTDPCEAGPGPVRGPAFRALPLGAVKPRGWLLRQLRIQADGLTGHLDEFWPDIARSGWIGGDADAWERGPYWLDGLIPLAWLLDDEALQAKARRWVDYILDHQHADGWLGPRPDRPDAGGLDPWPQYVLFKALTSWHEATGDMRVVPAMLRAVRRIDALTNKRPLESWARTRWPDLGLTLARLQEQTGEAWLPGLARKLLRQGYSWRGHFADFRFAEKQTQWLQENHVVNNAMGLKEAAVRARLFGDSASLAAAHHAIAALDAFHGQATGVFTGDESLAGTDPTQGTELCAVVEVMFSLEALLAQFGEAAFADRLERVAFNALPAAFTPDMWAHQYDQQANQVLCTVAPRAWTNNADDSNTYGLEPHFGCCTANMHQGWPKLVSHLWMATPDGGLAAAAYGPSTVSARVGDGAPVTVCEETDYPFRGEVRFRIEADRPVTFPLALRVPAWAAGATVRVCAEAPCEPEPGGFCTIRRTWRPGETVTVVLPMPLRVERRTNGAAVVSRGPLVFALRLGEQFRVLRGTPPQADFEVVPTTPWNYGLVLGGPPEDVLSVEERPVGEVPFAPESAPVVLKARARRLPGWILERNSAGPLPQSPVRSSEPLETVELVPYGSTNLRVTELPLLEG